MVPYSEFSSAEKTAARLVGSVAVPASQKRLVAKMVTAVILDDSAPILAEAYAAWYGLGSVPAVRAVLATVYGISC